MRGVFDKLDSQWAMEVKAVEKEAVALKKQGKGKEAAAVLDKFTEQCVNQAVAAIEDIKKLFA